jgi:hypothetical protein
MTTEKIPELFYLIEKEQIESVMNQDMCELDCTFLGFIEIYEHLSYIIPKNYTIIDFGCYLAAQGFYFQDHNKYIGVDLTELKRFTFKNTTHYIKSIQSFIFENLQEYDLDETFIICSYVPDREAKEMIRQNSKNLFIFYPSDKSHKWLF